MGYINLPTFLRFSMWDNLPLKPRPHRDTLRARLRLVRIVGPTRTWVSQARPDANLALIPVCCDRKSNCVIEINRNVKTHRIDVVHQRCVGYDYRHKRRTDIIQSVFRLWLQISDYKIMCHTPIYIDIHEILSQFENIIISKFGNIFYTDSRHNKTHRINL